MRLLFRGVSLVLIAGLASAAAQLQQSTPATSAQMGERLFLETRFAQYFYANSGGNPNNEPLPNGGDPTLAVTVTPTGTLPGPYRGLTMNCAQCHLSDQQNKIRAFADFAPRSPIPARGDGNSTTPRNAAALIDSTLPRAQFFYHLDGEFNNLTQLVSSTLTGRNFGWLPQEQALASQQIATIIRGDDGLGSLAQQYGGSYRSMFACTGQNTGYCLNVDTASDSEISNFIAARVTDYVRTLNFTQDSQGAFIGSPYDVFLVKNNLPRLPNAGELDADYTLRLAKAVNALTNPQYVTSSDGQFTQSPQPFKFGSQELRGLKIFLKSPKGSLATTQEITQGGIGNCLACHPAPKFSDFNFHTTGVSQAEYDGIHGAGMFQQLVVPDLKTRSQNYNRYLPATSIHPSAQGPFRRPATASNLSYTDLGLWNIFANPDFPLVPSSSIALTLGLTGQTNTQILPQTIARFKTPGLRGVIASDPYFHNGSALTLEDSLAFYRDFSNQARAQQVRNADTQLSRIALQDRDIAPLAAFLRGLTADLPSTP